MSDERAAMDQAGRYWDAVARGDGTPDPAFDPALARTIQRLHGLAATPSAEARERVWRVVLTNAEAARRQEEGSLLRAMMPNGRVLDAPRVGIPEAPPSGRQRWFLTQLATAALILLTLIGSFMVFGPGRVSRQQEPPVFIPAIEATPATPTLEVERPVAEFLWQSEGDPDLPLSDPNNLAIDPQGNIWVTDGRNSRFQIFAPDGTFLEAWGTPGEAEGELDFVEPTLFGGTGAGSMEFDAAGNLYVVDPGNFRIQKFGPDRAFITAWGGKGLEDGQFLAALDLAIDGQGRVYVTDETRGDVQLFDRDGRFLSVWSDAAEDWLGKPSAITIDGQGTIWVGHFQLDTVRHYAPDGSLLASWGESGIEEGPFNSPSGVSVDDQGRVYVNEYANNRIQVFDSHGTVLATWGGIGRFDSEFSFSGLNGSVLDAEGNIYVVQDGNDLIKKFRLLPPLAPEVALPDAKPESAPGSVAEFVWESEGDPEWPLVDPVRTAFDPQGNIWVTDGGNSRFQIFSPDGDFLEAWGNPGSAPGRFDFVDPAMFGGLGGGSMAFDAAGNLYVLDSGNYRVQKFGPDRTFLAAWGSKGTGDGQFMAPTDLTIDSQGRIFVTDEGSGRDDVQVFDSDGGFLSSWGDPDQGWLTQPSGITVDADGNLWIAHFNSNRVQKYTPDGALLATVGESGNGPGQFRNPSDLAVDEEGRLFVADWGSSRIQVFDDAGRFLAVWGDLGLDDGQLMGPNSALPDNDGNVYVAEDGNDRIQKFRLLPPLAPG